MTANNGASPDEMLWPHEVYDRAMKAEHLGLSMLRLLFHNAKWVHRRVESVKFHDDRTVGRYVSVDFTVPAAAPNLRFEDPYHPSHHRTGGPVRELRLLPVTLLRKKSLVNFDLRDETGTAVPLIGLRQTQRLHLRMLEDWAEVVLVGQGNGSAGLRDGEQLSGALRADIRRIVCGSQDVSSATSMGPLGGGFRHKDGTTGSPVMGPARVVGVLVA